MKYSALLLILMLCGCEIGYQKNEDSIEWVHWNEGTGKVVDVLDVSDPSKVKILNEYYAKDDLKVFWRQLDVKGADPSTFKVLHSEFSYASDKKAVYFQNKEIPNATPEDFTPTAHNYGVSKKHVFYQTHKIKGANPAVFIINEFEKSTVYGCYLAADFFACNKTYEH
jgi:hypothetical protein